jgi:putative hydrolase of the HAD superfamily
MASLTAIGFDADDTLWHNERFFRLTQARFAALLSDFTEADHLHERLLMAERRNLGHYGFGIKGFVLSMIETAIEVTGQKVPASVIAELIRAGQEMLAHPIELLPGARDCVEALKDRYRIVLVTKGDLLDQERKLAQSGLGDLFDAVEIVSHKTPAIYAAVFERFGGAQSGLMVGNSLKSDVLPMIAAGGWGVHVPHELTWALEHEAPPEGADRFRVLEEIGELPALVERIDM